MSIKHHGRVSRPRYRRNLAPSLYGRVAQSHAVLCLAMSALLVVLAVFIPWA